MIRNGAQRPVPDLAAELGRTVHAVRQRAFLLGVSLMKYGDADFRTKYSDAQVEACRVMHESGSGPAAIARATGIPLASVRSFVYYAGRHRPAVITPGGGS